MASKKQEVKYISYQDIAVLEVSIINSIIYEYKYDDGFIINYFIHKLNNKEYMSIETSTGMNILINPCKTKKECILKTNEGLDSVKNNIKKLIEIAKEQQLKGGYRNKEGLIVGIFIRQIDEKTKDYINIYKRAEV